MSTVQPTPPPDADELLARYHEAVALDAAAPDANLRAAVLAQAEVTAWRHAATAADDEDADALATDELPARAEPGGGEAEFSSELPLPAGAAAEAANERQWFIPAVASLAVLGLAALLALQFDRSDPAEQAVALGQRSAAPADAVPAAPRPEPAASRMTTESAPEVADPEATEPETATLEAAKPEAPTPDAATPEPATEPAPESEPPAPVPEPPPVTEPSPAAVVPEPTPAPTPSAAPPAAEPSPAAVAPKPTPEAPPAKPRTQAPRKPEQPAARTPTRQPRGTTRAERRPAPPPRPAAQRPPTPAAAPAALPDSAPAADATPLPPESAPTADPQLTPSTPAAARRPGPGGEFSAPELGYEHDRVPLPTASPRPFPASPGLDGTTAEPGTRAAGADQPATLTPSQRLLAAAAQGQVTAARNALQQGAAANASDGRGQTALMLAARRGDVAMARLLLASGADARRADRQGLSAIEHARRAGHEALARHLEQGASARPLTE